jgi:hypothetical protein
VKLNQVATVKAGYPFRAKIQEVQGTGVLAVQMKDVSAEGGINWETAVETELPGKRTPIYLKPGDILFAVRGNHNYAALVDDLVSRYRAVSSPQFFVLRCVSNEIVPEFLVWLLNQEPLQRYFRRESEGTLTKSIRRSVLENATIAVPPLERQHKIIQLAHSAMTERQLLKKLIKNNQVMMDGIAADLLNGMK